MRIFLIIVALIIISIGIYFYSLGTFMRINVVEKEIGPFQLVYKEHKGSYNGVGKIQMEIYRDLLNNEKIDTSKGFGIYYDNPKTVKEADLRSIVGVILEEKDYVKIPKLKTKYNIMLYPKTPSMTAEFPLKNILSIYIGVMKVYPVLSKYIKNKNYEGVPSMEIYDMAGKKIIYSMQVKTKKK
ncbi:MAG: GyrI-like domain-containing protein [Elusimicrobia bacterium]|nr:GyrI-like domain-containing protein [Elusimicrobiota bacterium]